MILRIQMPDVESMQSIKYHQGPDGSHYVWCEVENFAWHQTTDDKKTEMLDIRVKVEDADKRTGQDAQ